MYKASFRYGPNSYLIVFKMVNNDGLEEGGDGVEDANVHPVADQQQDIAPVHHQVPWQQN